MTFPTRAEKWCLWFIVADVAGGLLALATMPWWCKC